MSATDTDQSRRGSEPAAEHGARGPSPHTGGGSIRTMARPAVGSWWHDRGASQVLGAILVFGLLVTALGLYQTTVVPANNREVEVRHSESVRGDMVDLRGALLDAGLRGDTRGVTVATGTDYPLRAVSTNPPPPSGQLRTESVDDAVRLTDVRAADPEAAEYWADRGWAFDSAHVAYRPGYRYYGEAPTVRYEPTVLYSDFPDGEIAESSQRLVDGNRLDLVLVDGDVSTTGKRADLDVRSASAATRGVRVQAGDNARMRVKTRLSETTWEELLASESRASLAAYDDTTDPHVATVALEPGEYTLRAGRASLGTPAPREPAYLVSDGPTDRTLRGGGGTTFTVRVLDRSGNPVEGVTVQSDFAPDATTDHEGRVTLEYVGTAPSDGVVTAAPTVWFDGADAASVPDHRRVTYDVRVTGSTEPNLINPGTGFVVTGANITGKQTVAVTFDNRGDRDRQVTAARVNYYHPSPPGDGRSKRRVIESATSPLVDGTMVVGESFRPAEPGFAAESGERITADLVFEAEDGESLDRSVDEGDYFVLTLTFERGPSRIYFVTA